MKQPKVLRTISGKEIDPSNVQASDICIEDIAMGLSKVCRYSGQRKDFISVAEHSVHVSKTVPAKLALYGLLHDAAEAYMGDVPSPVKHLCPDFVEIEAGFERAVLEAFALPPLSDKDATELKYWDRDACLDEQLGHMQNLEYKDAYKLFMKRFQELTNEGQISRSNVRRIRSQVAASRSRSKV